VVSGKDGNGNSVVMERSENGNGDDFTDFIETGGNENRRSHFLTFCSWPLLCSDRSI